MKTRIAHVSITAGNLDRLKEFYMNALGFEVARPERDFSGDWLERGTGVTGAEFRRIHLRLPGADPDGTHLELIEYSETVNGGAPPAANLSGLRHIAIEAGSPGELRKLHDLVLENGGGELGEIAEQEIDGLGTVTFVYLTDPEGNIIELLNWRA
jgi:catechol 2,3-dioxygenase-like lactoylglutathione lyase family enzyme